MADSEPTKITKEGSRARQLGFIVGPLAFLLLVLLPAPTGMTSEAWRVAAVTLWMAIWWITEAIPIPATALLPMALYPLLGVMKSQDAAAPYANHLIYLFMGGFLLAVTMERWNLHRRIALHTIALVGTSPSRMILGFMIATGLLSMWVSNTATAMMMVPIGMAVIDQAKLQLREESAALDNFAKCLMLGIAYSASMGGVATIIGTPPNTVMAGMLETMFGVEIGFARWMLLGVPLAVVMIALSWLVLTRLLFPMKGVRLLGGSEIVRREIESLGKMSRQEKLVMAVGALAALFWISRGFIKRMPLMEELWPSFGHVHDATIAISCALLLFCIPTNFKRGEFLLDWQTAVKIPWGVMVLFGGGLAIANGFAKTGLATFVAGQLSALSGVSMLIFVGAVVLLTVFLTELTSNTATATLLIPIMGSAAVAMGIHPFATIVGATIAASFAFMLPVATPPNAVIFGSGRVTIKEMAKAGFWLNLLGSAAIVLFVVYLMPWLWGIDLGVLPAWAQKG